jgi:hypothetical protein
MRLPFRVAEQRSPFSSVTEDPFGWYGGADEKESL